MGFNSVIAAMDANTLVVRGRAVARALKVISTTRGTKFTMSSKPGRFEIQKTVYLLKQLGNSAASKFNYNIYLNGPYSPDLAQVYYALEDDGIANAPPAKEVSEEVARTIADALGRGEDFLEGLTTTVDGIARADSTAVALAWAKSIKPHLGEPTWQEVRRFLGDHPDLTRHN
jgi:hypothetical protein